MAETTSVFPAPAPARASQAAHAVRPRADTGVDADLSGSDRPFRRQSTAALHAFGERARSFVRHARRIASAAVARGGEAGMTRGASSAEARVAAFLLDLSDRRRANGYASSGFVLTATRREIGSLVGLRSETVSRVLHSLYRRGLVDVSANEICVLDLPGLALL